MESDQKVLAIGRYKVRSFLGRGGMAEAFKCELSGLGGFGKVVVVKRILAELAREPEFIRMFFDEARVSALLSHPNIVQVFEVDHDNGLPFIMMEYVWGPTLRQIFTRAGKHAPLPLAHAVHIMSDLCQGLHHAHLAKDPQGKPLGIVHRDVSPHNIIVSMSGATKILDFGVAKAHGKLAHTRVGTVKGKFAYMAPEQVSNEDVDRRADVFAVGIVLYRAATGQLPFNGRNEAEMLAATLDGRYAAPHSIVPDFPPMLEDILRVTLQRKPADRYQSAHEMQEALQEFASSQGLDTTPGALSAYLAKLFPGANDETFEVFDRAHLQKYYLSTPTGSSEALLAALTPSHNSSNPLLPAQAAVMAPAHSPWPLRVALAAAGVLALAAAGLAAVALGGRNREPAAVTTMAPGGDPEQAEKPLVVEPRNSEAAAVLEQTAAPVAKVGALEPAAGSQVPSAVHSGSRSRSRAHGATRTRAMPGQLVARTEPLSPDDVDAQPPSPPPTTTDNLPPASDNPVQATTGAPPPAPPDEEPVVEPPEPARPLAQPAPPPAASPRPGLAPRPKVSAPSLPGSYRANSAPEVIEAFRRVEDQLISVGGVSPSTARNVTAPLAQALIKGFQPGQSIAIYPESMYYFVADRAREGRSRGQIAESLKSAHLRGSLQGYASSR